MADETPDTPTEGRTLGEPVSPSSASDGETAKGMERLPPPAFPPGRRRGVPRRNEGERKVTFPDDAFISPDDPIRHQGRGIPDDAFISPDDPIVKLRNLEDGTVTGIGADRGQDHETHRLDGLAGPKPTIHELPYLLDQLATRIQESGDRALEVRPDTGHFQAALAAFLRGYLAGSRD